MLPALAPGTLAAQGLSLTTQFPSVTVTPGTQVSIDLAVDANEDATVALALSGVPASWTAELHGGGYVVGAVFVDGNDPTTVRLDVDVPSDASGTTRINVRASATGTTVDLPISITAQIGAGGEVNLETDVVALQGPASDTFTFTTTLRNDKEEDLTFTTTAEGPVDWDVEAKATAQSNAVTAVVKAGAVAQITVTATPPDDVVAGEYPLNLSVVVGEETLTQDLQVNVTGSYTLELSTPTQVLSARGSAGGITDQQFTITNTGSAPLTNVVMTATPPGELDGRVRAGRRPRRCRGPGDRRDRPHHADRRCDRGRLHDRVPGGLGGVRRRLRATSGSRSRHRSSARSSAPASSPRRSAGCTGSSAATGDARP